MVQLTPEYLRDILDYQPDTGEFYWKIGPRRLAGTVRKDGYCKIGINNVYYFAHRLAWLYINGCWPDGQIDHIDRNPSNNSINNLRDVSGSINQKNRRKNSNNSSGVSGVTKDNRNGKWTARICINKKLTHLGIFKDYFEAVCARKSAETRHGHIC